MKLNLLPFASSEIIIIPYINENTNRKNHVNRTVFDKDTFPINFKPWREVSCEKSIKFSTSFILLYEIEYSFSIYYWWKALCWDVFLEENGKTLRPTFCCKYFVNKVCHPNTNTIMLWFITYFFAFDCRCLKCATQCL